NGELYPASPERRALAERWMDWQLTTLMEPVTVVFQALIRNTPPNPDPAVLARRTAEANAALALLDAHLAKRRYVAGDEFTMADIPGGAGAHRWLELPGIERPPFAAATAWRARLAERPGFRAHVMLPLS